MALLFDWRAHQVAPFGPGAIVVLDVWVTKQVFQHEPGMAGTLADAAVGDHGLIRANTVLLLVNRSQLVRGLEGTVGRIRRSRPGDALRPRNMAAALRSLLRIVQHMDQLTLVLGRRSNVDERRACFALARDFLTESPDARIRFLGTIGGPVDLGCFARQRAILLLPLQPAAVHDAHVRMPEQL